MEIIVLEGKHYTSYFKGSTPEEREESALKIMKMHLQMGYYSYPDGLSDRVQKEIENPSGKAWRFVQGRSAHEYERVELEKVQ